MFEGCLDDGGCEADYLEALEAVQTIVPQLNLDTLAVCTAEMLAPWQQLEEEESTRFEYDAGEIADAVAETRAFIADRPEELADFLGNAAPAQPAPVDSCPPSEEEIPDPGSQPGSGSPAQTPNVETPPSAQLRFVFRKAKRLQIGIVSPAGGSLKVTAKSLGRRGVHVCSARIAVVAGPATVSCRLSQEAIKRLEDGPLRVKVSVRLPAAAAPLSRQARLASL